MEERISELKPFPTVKVAKKRLDDKWAAQYRERAQPPRIELGAVLFTMTAQERKVAVYHEIGHWLRCEHLPRPKNGEKGEEEFAEAFTQFMIWPKALKQRSPETHLYFERMVRGKRKKLDAFATRILRDLDRQHFLRMDLFGMSRK